MKHCAPAASRRHAPRSSESWIRTHHDSAGYAIAWLSQGQCRHPDCRKAEHEGRLVNIVPAPGDPRADEFTLALNTYHYVTPEEAIAALEEAWSSAEIAETVEQRDDAYSRNVCVRIRKGIVTR